jgi:hypothetical protein
MRVPYFGQMRPSVEVSRPWAYVIPPQWTDVIARLAVHGVEMQELEDQNLEVERYRLHDVRWEARSFEGHHLVNCSASVEKTSVHVARGSRLVSTQQKRSRLAMHALEPRAPDSFLRWGFFDTILEQKEYAEDYAAESLAVAMLAAQPGLKHEYDSLLAADTAFANTPEARRDFFYKRSPWAEPMFNVYPVLRLPAPTSVELLRRP